MGTPLTRLKAHLKTFALAALFGMTAYGVIRLMILLHRWIVA